MKTTAFSIAATVVALTARLPFCAADDRESPPSGPPEAEVGTQSDVQLPTARPFPPMPERRGGSAEDDGAVARWLERLRDAQPEEFARLRRLRENNPAAFRDEMRRRLFPRRGPEGDDSEARRGPRLPPRPERDPKLEAIEAELLQLARQYHTARDPALREELRAQVRNRLREIFQRREAVWMSRIAAMRRDLDALEKRLEQFRQGREAAIEDRLRDILLPLSPPARDPNADGAPKE